MTLFGRDGDVAAKTLLRNNLVYGGTESLC